VNTRGPGFIFICTCVETQERFGHDRNAQIITQGNGISEKISVLKGQIRLNGSNFLLTVAIATASKENSASLKIKVSEFITGASLAV
jgi:hypothetical protein